MAEAAHDGVRKRLAVAGIGVVEDDTELGEGIHRRRCIDVPCARAVRLDDHRRLGIELVLDLAEDLLDENDEGAHEGESLAHAVMRRLGHLPRIGETVSLGPGVTAEVKQTKRRRIERVRVRVAEPRA